MTVKKSPARFIWPAVAALVLAALVAMVLMRPVEVGIAVVRRGSVEEVVTEEARTQLHTERAVTAELPGTAQRVELEEGDNVEDGQTVTTIEDTDLRLYLDVLRAQLKEVEARLEGVDVPLPKPSEIDAAGQDAVRAEHEVQALEQDVASAEADLQYADRDFRRVKALFDAGSVTDREYEEARRVLASAQAAHGALADRLAAARAAAQVAGLRKQVLVDRLGDTAYMRDVYAAQMEQSRKEIDLLTHELEKSTVRSPIAGVVLEKQLDSRQFVQPGAPLITVGDMGTIEIRADILSDDVGRVKVGQKVHLIGRAVRDPSVLGEVRKIYPSGFTKISSLGVRQQRVAVLIGFDNSKLDLKPGYKLDVQIVVDSRENAVLVPADAVFASAEGMAVFAVEGGKARVRPVKLGLKGEQDYEVTAGLEPDERVVRRPPTDLKPGRRVKARPE
jgi:HlyD family secretion protein